MKHKVLKKTLGAIQVDEKDEMYCVLYRNNDKMRGVHPTYDTRCHTKRLGPFVSLNSSKFSACT
jgi:hypothetical protein